MKVVKPIKTAHFRGVWSCVWFRLLGFFCVFFFCWGTWACDSCILYSVLMLRLVALASPLSKQTPVPCTVLLFPGYTNVCIDIQNPNPFTDSTYRLDHAGGKVALHRYQHPSSLPNSSLWSKACFFISFSLLSPSDMFRFKPRYCSFKYFALHRIFFYKLVNVYICFLIFFQYSDIYYHIYSTIKCSHSFFF